MKLKMLCKLILSVYGQRSDSIHLAVSSYSIKASLVKARETTNSMNLIDLDMRSGSNH